MTFIKGRQIIDVALIANECVARVKQSLGILCTLEIEKQMTVPTGTFLLKF